MYKAIICGKGKMSGRIPEQGDDRYMTPVLEKALALIDGGALLTASRDSRSR